MKKSYNIEIDCAVCANKCQEAISKIQGVNSCSINFIMQKMTLDADDGEYNNILKQAIKTAKKIEPDFSIEE